MAIIKVMITKNNKHPIIKSRGVFIIVVYLTIINGDGDARLLMDW